MKSAETLMNGTAKQIIKSRDFAPELGDTIHFGASSKAPFDSEALSGSPIPGLGFLVVGQFDFASGPVPSALAQGSRFGRSLSFFGAKGPIDRALGLCHRLSFG